MKNKNKSFPNGFTSWMETHHEVVEYITNFIDSFEIPEDELPQSEIKAARDANGTTGLYEVAENWTDEFENINKGRDWDGEFMDEINTFCISKNNSQE